MPTWLLKGGWLVDPVNGRDGRFDILIENERIARVGPICAGRSDASGPGAEWTGRLPGPDRHARPPARAGPGAQGDRGHRHGRRRRRRIHRGRLHAEHVAGQRQRRRHRATSCRRRTRPSSRGSIRLARCRADRQGEQLADIAELRQAGCVAITDDGHPVATALLMRRALEYAGMFDMPVIEHCEDQTLKGDGVAHEGFHASSLGLRGIPGEAESIMALRDISLAELTGGAVHIAHMSARQTLDAVRYGKSRGARVTCEVTPHHFVLTDEMLGAPMPYDTNAKMNPPLREAADRDAMLQGLADGSVDVDRDRSRAASLRREAGRVRPRAVRHHRTRDGGVACFDRLVHRGVITLSRLIELLSANPARILQGPRRLAVGGCAGRRHHPGARPRRSPSLRARCDRDRRTRRSMAGGCAAASPRPSSAGASSM